MPTAINNGFGPLLSSPKEPPPQVFTTVNGTLQGTMDGVNTIFSTTVWLKRGVTYRNGILQTHGVDVVVNGNAVVFINGVIPLAGEIITVLGNPGP